MLRSKATICCAFLLSLALHSVVVMFAYDKIYRYVPIAEKINHEGTEFTRLSFDIVSTPHAPIKEPARVVNDDHKDTTAFSSETPDLNTQPTSSTNEPAAASQNQMLTIQDFDPRKLLKGGLQIDTELDPPFSAKDLTDPWQPDTAHGAQAVRSTAATLPFAENFAAYLSMPRELRSLENRGFAEAIVRLKKQRYEVSRVEGDPYFRALLYEALSHYLDEDSRQIELHRLDGATIRVRLRWQILIDSPGLMLPEDIVLDGHTLTLNYYQVLAPEYARWIISREQDSGHATLGINLLAPIFLALEHLSKEDPQTSVTLRRLRTSPAFQRPLR